MTCVCVCVWEGVGGWGSCNCIPNRSLEVNEILKYVGVKF